MLTTIIVILGCGVLGFVFWTSDKYRAATPLVFIFGAVVLLVPASRSLLKLFMPPQRRATFEAETTARRAKADETALWRSGIPQLVTNLYFGHIRNYPEWVKESRDYVPTSVTNAGRTDEGWVRLLMFFSDYVFPYKEWVLPNQVTTEYKEAVVEIIREGQKVLILRAGEVPDKRGVAHWTPIAIESFAMGDWIRDFQNLKAEILAIIKDREREARES